MSHEQLIRKNRVFILGAGFSAAAGVPLTNELLVEAMRLFAAECPGIYSRVENYALEAMGSKSEILVTADLSFSDLCTFLEFIELREYGGGERWSSQGSREKLALRFYLAKTIVKRTPSLRRMPDLYKGFAAQLHPGDIVLSLNWDGLLEAAITSVGKKYTYDQFNDEEINISKLHGSVNWRLGEAQTWNDRPESMNWSKLDFRSGMMTESMYACSSLLEKEAWLRHGPLSEVNPYLVLPGYGKAFDVRANAPLWYKPEFAFAFSHDVYIIGLSLAHDDFFVRSFFLSNLPFLQDYSGVIGRNVFIINPAATAQAEYDFVLSRGYAEFINEKFSLDHVAKMAAALTDA